ncbi:hypothetical protein H0W26_03655, partial [Candidatus Dependentiae bacterium]|nr:hypothetical protein [Candidatus Dependentiae bacterium]
QALEIFGRIPTSRNNIMVIFTDGEDFSPHLTGLKDKSRKVGLHIFTIGMGTLEGAPIPLYDQQGAQIGYQKDSVGKIVISRLNEDLLTQLSIQTGAEFIAASPDSSDMKQLTGDVQKFEKEKFEAPEIEVKQENYGFFALASLVLLLLEWIV